MLHGYMQYPVQYGVEPFWIAIPTVKFDFTIKVTFISRTTAKIINMFKKLFHIQAVWVKHTLTSDWILTFTISVIMMK